METTAIETGKKFITGPAGKLFVDVRGKTGTPVLFIHSFGGSTAHWENQLKHLEKQHVVIAMDLRGHGQSDTPEDNDYSVPSIVNDIETIVDDLVLDSFILVGHSMGGSAAIAYAGKHPEKIKGLLVTGTPGKSDPEMAKKIVASLESDKYEAVMADYMKKLLANASPETNELEMKGMNNISKEASIAIIRSIFSYDPIPDLEKYKGPAMIIDKADEDQPNSLHHSFPKIPHATIGGTSHWIQLDKPDEFNEQLDSFLDHLPVRR